jgi:hypothetical protein
MRSTVQQRPAAAIAADAHPRTFTQESLLRRGQSARSAIPTTTIWPRGLVTTPSMLFVVFVPFVVGSAMSPV